MNLKLLPEKKENDAHKRTHSQNLASCSPPRDLAFVQPPSRIHRRHRAASGDTFWDRGTPMKSVFVCDRVSNKKCFDPFIFAMFPVLIGPNGDKLSFGVRILKSI